MNGLLARLVSALIALATVGCSSATGGPQAQPSGRAPGGSPPTGRETVSSAFTTRPPDVLRVQVVERRPHDPTAYTQGLAWADDRLYEGTGLYGRSTLREVDPHTGVVLRSTELDTRLFGEGIAVVDDRLIQLTWQEHTALVYRLHDFSHVDTFSYETQGWGLCDDGTRLVMSDGTSVLYFRDRSTFALLGSVTVTSRGAPLQHLNELECVDGQVYANVWPSERIVRIDPSSGVVTAEIDASRLLADDEAAEAGVLNGIAHDATHDTLLLTGKLWPALFEVRFVPR